MNWRFYRAANPGGRRSGSQGALGLLHGVNIFFVLVATAHPDRFAGSRFFRRLHPTNPPDPLVVYESAARKPRERSLRGRIFRTVCTYPDSPGAKKRTHCAKRD